MFRLVEWLGITNLCSSARISYEIARKELDQHLKDYQPNHPRDFIDAYVDEMNGDKSKYND